MTVKAPAPLIAVTTEGAVYCHAIPPWPVGFNATEAMCVLDSSNDWDAVLVFLNEYRDKPTTFHTYCKEVERFLLFLLHIAKKPLSAVNMQDWKAYLAFLAAPPVEWCGKKTQRFNAEQANPDWRPFDLSMKAKPLARLRGDLPEGSLIGLSASSIRLNVRIINALFAFLCSAGYLHANPCAQRRSRNQRATNKHAMLERQLDIALVDEVIDYQHHLAQIAHNERERKAAVRGKYIVQLLVGTGLRREEVTKHTFGNIVISKDKWTLVVVGKGDKPRRIRLFDDLVASIKEFRESYGLHPTPLFGEDTPLVPSERKGGTGLTCRRVDQIVRDVFDRLAREKLHQANTTSNKDTQGQLLREASILEQASPHWLRHSHATYFLKHSGNDLKATMERLGHADVGTTMLYIHASDEDH